MKLTIYNGAHKYGNTWKDMIEDAIARDWQIDLATVKHLCYPVKVYDDGKGFRVWEDEYLLTDESQSFTTTLLDSINGSITYQLERKPIPVTYRPNELNL